VLRTPSQDEDIYLDPHQHGDLMTREECGKLTEDVFGRMVHLSEEYFKPCTKRQLLVNLLSYLKMMHVRRRDYRHAIAAADRVALLDPYMGSNLKERAWMFYRTHRYAEAIEDLEAYLDLNPVSDDADSVRAQIRSLWDTQASLS
jgi:regulator of sirC expression with transglutaminase-like and TPR domain